MKKTILFLTFLLTVSGYLLAQEQFKIVSGRVYDAFGPLQNVNITVKETSNGVKTNSKGSYSISVEEGQTLLYSYVGKKPMEIVVEDVTQYLNVEMFDRIEKLEGVTVTKRKRRNQNELLKDYNEDKDLIKTAFGIMDKKRIGYRMVTVDGEDLSLAGQDFVDGLQSLIPGMQVFRPNALRPGGGARNMQLGRPTDLSIPIVFLPRALRSINVVPAIYDVDGVIYTDAPTFINVHSIERIAVIESLAGVARYGSMGAGGVIIINTKVGNTAPREPGSQKPFDQAKLRNNFVSGEEVALTLNHPEYITRLQETTDRDKAQELFVELESRYASSPYFYLDTYSFFINDLKDKSQADKIQSQIREKYRSNPTILKALAYLLEEAGESEKAIEVYKEVFILRPHYVQSYLDLANAYRNAGHVENAANLFARYNHLINESFFKESEALTPIASRDFDNLLNRNGALVGETKITLPTNEDTFKGTRLVFEWNDGEAEFDLQFVNPEKQYFTWNHSLRDNPERISEEKRHGFSTEEYLIYEPINGTWSVNVKYLGNKSLTPAYLKVTAYHNFNTKDQKRTVQVFRLGEKNKNLQLFSVNSSNLFSIN